MERKVPSSPLPSHPTMHTLPPPHPRTCCCGVARHEQYGIDPGVPNLLRARCQPGESPRERSHIQLKHHQLLHWDAGTVCRGMLCCAEAQACQAAGCDGAGAVGKLRVVVGMGGGGG